MIEFTKKLYQLLNGVSERVYQEQVVADDVVFPYVTFNPPTLFDDEHLDAITFEVDVWDNKADTTALEQLTTDIDYVLNRYKYYDSVNQFSIYRISRFPIPDPDQKIRRRQLRYQIRGKITT